ncbi:HesA/MoeB/ThiF family protein [Deinococcus sp.]|uniref:HesA/MoeB/ThiF family protein n=1 Tax=Deinococcus sp. TaxID=47478 RepID=UPI0025BAB4CE|nr:HesA/MoeB/ThiF family protein [Deinococcus sp.]
MKSTVPARPTLSRSELRRYSRPLLVPEWHEAAAQERLKASRVLIVGAGGLGGPVILQLAGAGAGHLSIADGDTVSLSNLHRQTLFTVADVGRLKSAVACARAQQLNPHVSLTALPALTRAGAQELVAGYDLVIDATDNFETRYAIADACTAAGRTWVWGAASGTSGLVSVFDARFGLRDVFPVADDTGSCAEAGVIGPVPNIVGGMMALEALKVLGGVGQPLYGRLWTFEALSGRSRIISLNVASMKPAT